MATTNADIVAELSSEAECDDFAAYLTEDRATAVFLQSSATQSLTNFPSAVERQAEMAGLVREIAADRTALPGITDERRRLRAEGEIIDKDARLNGLRKQGLSQGGDDRARKQHERNGYEDRIARADVLLPMVATRKIALSS